MWLRKLFRRKKDKLSPEMLKRAIDELCFKNPTPSAIYYQQKVKKMLKDRLTEPD